MLFLKGCELLTKVMTKAWSFSKISHDLGNGLCDYLRNKNYFEILINLFIKENISDLSKFIYLFIYIN